MGPAGLFNWMTNPPVPDPWQASQFGWAYYKDREEARAVLRGLSREPAVLPRPNQNVGALLAYSSFEGGLVRLSTPCAIQTPEGNPGRVLVVYNDELFKNYGSGRLYVSALWPPVIIQGNQLPACTE
jgi:hypothetical protein